MMVKAGRWKQLTMTERWLILNGLSAIQTRRREQGTRSITLRELKIYTAIRNTDEGPSFESFRGV